MPSGGPPESFAQAMGIPEQQVGPWYVVPEKPELSVIVPTKDRAYWFGRCMKSIRENTPAGLFELIVVDSSNVPIKAMLPDEVVYVADTARDGFTRACNRGFRIARGRYVVWLNDDAEVQPDWATVAIKYMDDRPDVGMGALCWRDHGNGTAFLAVNHSGIRYANFGIVRKELGDALGWFDEELVFYASDSAFGIRMLASGHGVGEVRGSNVIHYRANDDNRKLSAELSKNDTATFQRKYGPIINQLLNTSKLEGVGVI